jgi:hypothetical protein
MGAYRSFALQCCRALPVKVGGMQLSSITAPSIHFRPPIRQRQFSTRSRDVRGKPQQTRWVQRPSHAIPSAARQAAQMHLDNSRICSGGLQRHVKDVRASQNGSDAGHNSPSRSSQHTSSNGVPHPIEQPSDRESGREKPHGAQNSHFTSPSNHPAGLKRQPPQSVVPPHLFKATRTDQQAGNGVLKKHSAPAAGTPTLNGTKVAAGDLRATLPPAEVADSGEKAEGVIRLGTHGTPIPLYGRTLQSIREVCSCSFPSFVLCKQASSPLLFLSA